jgi:hypothetical protein
MKLDGPPPGAYTPAQLLTCPPTARIGQQELTTLTQVEALVRDRV